MRTFLVLLALVGRAAAQGRLEQAWAATDAPGDSTPADRPAADDGSGSLLGELLAPLFVAAVTAPFAVPNQLLETLPHDAAYPAHPYADGPGYLRGSDGKPWALRLSVEDGNDFNGLNRLGVRAAFDTGLRFGVETNWDHFTERLGCGCVDEFTLGDVMLTCRFVQSPTVQMHTGLGACGLFDRHTARGGVNFFYAAEVFPVEPVVIAGRVEAGTLGSAFVTRLRSTAGVQWRRAEVFVGYDWLRIGGVDLHGPLAGVRLSF